MSSSTLAHASSTTSLSKRLSLAIGAGLLGALLVYFAGFSHIDAVHNAAHDTRHSLRLPLPLSREGTRMIKRIAQTAGFAGLLAALLLTLLQILWVTPLILEAETYEKSEPVAAQPHEHTPGVAAHVHDEEAWEPEDGWQRTLSTTGGNLVVAVGFALMLAGLFTLRAPGQTWQGLLWGLAGYAVFCLAPSLGLPPEAAGYRRGRPGATPVLVDRHRRRHRGGPGPAGVRRQLAAEAGRRRPAGAAAPVRRAAARGPCQPGAGSPGPAFRGRLAGQQCAVLGRPRPGRCLAVPAQPGRRRRLTACHPRPLPVAGP